MMSSWYVVIDGSSDGRAQALVTKPGDGASSPSAQASEGAGRTHTDQHERPPSSRSGSSEAMIADRAHLPPTIYGLRP